MNRFERADIAPAEITPSAMKDSPVPSEPDYAAYTELPTGVPGYDAATTVAALDYALGRRLATLLLEADPGATLRASAKVLKKHKPEKDLQANLIANSVREIVAGDGVDLPEERRRSEDILRRCSLDPDFKKRVAEPLIQGSAFTHAALISLTR